MRKFTLTAIVLLLQAGLCNAASVPFEDIIDTWGPSGIDAIPIVQGSPLTYQHDLTDNVDFDGGWTVSEATLELDFTNDWLDGKKLWGLVQWDHREFAWYAYDGAAWVAIGEVDKGLYPLALEVDWLNDDGKLDVTVGVWNAKDSATAWLDHSRVYGTAISPQPLDRSVPEPLSIVGVGLAAASVSGYLRRRRSA
jgi:NADPH-dependent 7-cyano-7-deazaguanine reductase QueF-like protein